MNNITTKVYPNKQGVYCIENKVTGYIYIGSTICLYKRLIHHKHRLNTNSHGNAHLQRSFNKHGIKVFKITILELCDCNKKDLWKKEEYYCTQYTNLYNIKTIEKTNFGFKRTTSKETRKKMSDSKKGKIPKNLSNIQQKRRRKIIKIVDKKVVQTFNSCVEAADSLNMKPNNFNQYIGKKLGRKKSKYFPKNTQYEYY